MASAAFYCRRSAFWRFSMTEASNRLHKTRVPSQPPYSLYIHKQLLRWDAFLIFSYCQLFEIPKLHAFANFKNMFSICSHGKTPCRFERTGTCRAGDSCRFCHLCKVRNVKTRASNDHWMKFFSTWFAGEQNESLPPVRHCPSCKVFVKQKSHGVRNNVSSFQSFGPSPSLHCHHAFLGLVAS